MNFAVFVFIFTSKLPVLSPLLSFILNLTTATHCTEAAEASRRSSQRPAALLHCYSQAVLEYACPVWHSGLTAGQCDAIENIQKRAIRVVYSDTDSDYEIALIVAEMDSLKDRREMLMARFFKRQAVLGVIKLLVIKLLI